MKYASLTDVGLRREKNQDSYCCIKNKYDDFLAIVCDGIGGGKAGDVASGETVKYYINEFKKSGPFNSLDDAKKFINNSINKINDELFKLSNKYAEFKGMGTTLTGVLFTSFGTLCINIGDSRVYGFNNKKIYHLTKDHTLVNKMLDKGQISFSEAINHPKKHYLVKALGVTNKVEADINKIKDFDYLLICSDGLYNLVDENDLIHIVTTKRYVIEKKCSELIKLALVKGGYDNITVIVIDNNG